MSYVGVVLYLPVSVLACCFTSLWNSSFSFDWPELFELFLEEEGISERLVMSCLVLSYIVLFCFVLFCLALPCLV